MITTVRDVEKWLKYLVGEREVLFFLGDKELEVLEQRNGTFWLAEKQEAKRD